MLSKNAVHEELGFVAEGLAQAVVEIREQGNRRTLSVEVSQLQPLAHEVAHERLGAPVCEHAPYLLVEDGGVAEPAGGSDIEQLIVRNAAPDEEREP